MLYVSSEAVGVDWIALEFARVTVVVFGINSNCLSFKQDQLEYSEVADYQNINTGILLIFS